MPTNVLEQDILLLKRLQDAALQTKAILEQQQAAIEALSTGNKNNLTANMLKEITLRAEETKGAYDTLIAAQEQFMTNAKIIAGGGGTAPAPGKGVNVVPGGASSGTSELKEELRLAEQLNNLSSEVDTKYASGAKKRAAASLEILENEQKRLALIQQEVQYNERYSKANEIAAKAGYSPSQLTRLKEVGTAGVVKATYEGEDKLTGANKQLDLFITKAGDAIPAVSRQFQTMGTAIARDTVELLKWTIAIGLIYGPLREIQTLTTQMIANQASLATAMIALVGTSTSVGQVFGIIADAANKMGEDVGASIDIFTQAYRATGGLGNQYERVKTASELMSTAMTLAKLSGMDYNTAIDTLTASLRQMGLALDNGGSLLDKWVAVSKVANVDIQTLSTGFSILGESAGAAGLDTEHLNALLATISETLGLTDRQAGNAAKAFISGFGTSKAQKSLQDIGIAATDLNGELRPVVDIMKELASLNAAGVLSSAQFTQVTAAIGGGTRRQAVVAAVVGSQERMNEIVLAQQNSQGAAAQALATKLDTVQTSLVRLGNALQSIAQTMGNQGGVLDIFSFLLDNVTKLVTAIDALSAALGKTAPILATVLLATAVMKIRPDIRTGFTGGVSNLLSVRGTSEYGTTQEFQDLAKLEGGTPRGFIPFGGQGPSKLAQFMMGSSPWAGAALGGLTALIPAIQNFSQGNAVAGGGNLVGGAIGGALGSLVAPGFGTVIGASIGSGIAEAFVKNVLQYKGEIGGAFAQAEANAKAQAAAEAAKPGATPTGTAEERFMAVQQQVLSAGGGKVGNVLASWLSNASMSLTGQVGRFNPEMVGFNNASPELQQQYRDANQALLVSQGKGKAGTTVSSEAQLKLQNDPQIARMAAELQKTMQEQLLGQLTGKGLGGGRPSGSITSAQYTAGMTNIASFGEVAAKMSVAFGPEFMKQAVGIKDMKDEYQAFIDLLVYGGDAETKTLTQLASQISMVTDNLDVNNLEMTINGEVITKTREEWEKYLADLKLTAGASAAAMASQVEFSKLKQPNVVGGNTALQSVSQFNAIVSYAQQLDEKRIRAANPGITDSQLAMYKSKLDDFITLVTDAGEEVFKNVTGISAQSFQEAEAFLKQLGKVGRAQAPGSAQFQEINLSSKMYDTIVTATKVMEQRLSKAGLPINEQDIIAYFNDDQFKGMHLDNVALRLILEQILNVEQKQLDQGMWNVPEGTTLWAPFTSEWNATHNAAQGGGGPGKLDLTGEQYKGPEDTANYIKNATYADYAKYLAGKGTLGQSVTLSPAEKYAQEGSLFNIKNRGGRNIIDTRKEAIDEYLAGGAATPIKSTPTPPSFWSSITGGVFDKGGFFDNMFNGNMWKHPDSGSSLNAPTAKLGLNLTSHMTIQLDGRTVATAIKVYLLNDLVAMSKAYGTTSKDYVV